MITYSSVKECRCNGCFFSPFTDVPSFSDSHIPVVAREILQRMIQQFAAEYTSKTSSPQDSCSDTQPRSDQSLLTPPLLSGAPPASPAATLAGPAHNQNPVLSKLLMADQDAPLDLTIKKPLAEPSEQGSVNLNTVSSVTEQLIQDWPLQWHSINLTFNLNGGVTCLFFNRRSP